MLAQHRDVLPLHSSCALLDKCFDAEPDRSSFLVATSEHVLLVNRHTFYEAMSGRLGYGRTLHHARSVELVVPQTALVLPADTPVEEAALLTIATDAQGRDDVLVRLEDGWGSVSVLDLQRRLAALYEAQVVAIRQSHARFCCLVENAVDVIAVVDRSARLQYVSRDVEGVPATAIGASAFANVLPDDMGGLEASFDRLLRQPRRELWGDFRVRAHDGSLRTFEYNARNLLADPNVDGIVVNYRDVTARRGLEEELRHHALHDPLTGLANRHLLFERAAESLDRPRRTRGSVSVLYCDLDGFKQVNDGLGHAIGDEVLVEASRRLSEAVRGHDTVARFGGDEFVVLAEGCPPAEAAELALRVVRSFGRPLVVSGHAVEVSVSVGYATADGNLDAAGLLKQADLAMYSAKVAGRNRCVEFSNAAQDGELRRRRLTADLRLALPRGELHVAYQPIFDAHQGGMVGTEALLRWNHSLFGAVSPAELIPLAEAHGLIDRIGRWVLHEACRTLGEWDVLGVGPAWMSVNLSADQLDDPSVVDHVAAALHNNGLRPAQLHLELTESAIVVGVAARLAVLRELRDLGVSIALDDFGTGYSSLSSFGHLPIDVVKIDRSFIVDLAGSAEAAVVLRGIIELAHSLGYRVVAEGVERPEELRLLEGMACDYVQGFLLGRPVAPNALVQLWVAEGA
jgi:diguanylate cyclase (GGDEF)-like protein/PAS domain S-box-containing protein